MADDEPVNPPDPAALIRVRQQAIAGTAPNPAPEGIDKRAWGPGPWQNEPDRVEWVSGGLPCVLSRNPMYGTWCGYVGVPPGHPWHGRGWPELEDVQVHGCVTYADGTDPRAPHIRSMANPREYDPYWWVGFDCGHAFDLMPVKTAFGEACALIECALGMVADEHWHYRDVKYAGAQCELLVHQALEATR